VVLSGGEPILESLNRPLAYLDADLTKAPGQTKNYATAYDNATTLAHAVARVQTVATPAFQAAVVLEVVAHFRQLATGKKSPKREICGLWQEPRLQEQFVVNQFGLLFDGFAFLHLGRALDF
jgi:hypothetical protein